MELKGKYIFMLGLMRYDNAIESTNYTIARHLAQHNHVFYFDNPYTYKDYFRLRGMPAFERRKPHFSFSSDGIIDTDIPTLKVVISPPTASVNWLPEGRLYRAALHGAEKTILRRMKGVKKQLGIRKVIYINSFNFYYPDLGRMLMPQLSVYHCVDPLVHAYELKHGRRSEDQLARESDLVICTSNHLVQSMRRLNPDTWLVPNAADVAHSGKALDASLPVHASLAGIPGPVVGYFGAVERRIDYDLLRPVVAQNRDKSFVFAGPVSPEHIPDWLYDEPNVFLTGPVPYEALPQVLKGFDVAMIPFKKDEISAGIFPLKLFEYLGAGLPVVATDFNADLADYTRDTVAYCNNTETFSAAVNAALYVDNASLKAARLAVAAENTWERRADEFAAIIHHHLENRQAPVIA